VTLLSVYYYYSYYYYIMMIMCSLVSLLIASSLYLTLLSAYAEPVNMRMSICTRYTSRHTRLLQEYYHDDHDDFYQYNKKASKASLKKAGKPNNARNSTAKKSSTPIAAGSKLIPAGRAGAGGAWDSSTPHKGNGKGKKGSIIGNREKSISSDSSTTGTYTDGRGGGRSLTASDRGLSDS
jgi:hypothetical protein